MATFVLNVTLYKCVSRATLHSSQVQYLAIKKQTKKKSSTPDQPLGVTMQILTRAEAMFCYLLHFKVAYPQALKLLCEQF